MRHLLGFDLEAIPEFPICLLQTGLQDPADGVLSDRRGHHEFSLSAGKFTAPEGKPEPWLSANLFKAVRRPLLV